MTTIANRESTGERWIVVTGATGGIGRATALALAQRGASLLLVARDAADGAAVRDEILRQQSQAAVRVLQADLSEQQAVRRLAAQISEQAPRLHGLINSAAIFRRQRSVTPDGLESMFATNHLAPFLLTNLLLEPLKASGEGRIINLTAPSTTLVHFDDLQSEKSYRALWAFGATKMANLLFTFELARRLEGEPVTVNAVHPGLVRTGLMQEAPALLRWMTRFGSATPAVAALPIAELALSPAWAGQSGKFFRAGKEIAAPAWALERAHQQQLWDASLKLTHLQDG